MVEWWVLHWVELRAGATGEKRAGLMAAKTDMQLVALKVEWTVVLSVQKLDWCSVERLDELSGVSTAVLMVVPSVATLADVMENSSVA